MSCDQSRSSSLGAAAPLGCRRLAMQNATAACSVGARARVCQDSAASKCDRPAVLRGCVVGRARVEALLRSDRGPACAHRIPHPSRSSGLGGAEPDLGRVEPSFGGTEPASGRGQPRFGRGGSRFGRAQPNFRHGAGSRPAPLCRGPTTFFWPKRARPTAPGRKPRLRHLELCLLRRGRRV